MGTAIRVAAGDSRLPATGLLSVGAHRWIPAESQNR